MATGKDFRRALLSSTDVFMLDIGSEIFVCVGKGASAMEKKAAMIYANEYLLKQGKLAHSPISRTLEGGEGEVFEHSLDFLYDT